MLKVQEIRELIRLIDKSSITEFEYEYEGNSIKLKKYRGRRSTFFSATGSPVDLSGSRGRESITSKSYCRITCCKSRSCSTIPDTLHKITSPMVGTFYKASSPDSDPYVQIGTKVKKDSTVCIVEAMKLFNEIDADVEGEIVEILVEDGQLVEFGQPLFLVKE
ncbi:acetyl-CoA carboxylase [Bacillus coahuilensis p1.1.43]|uniref:Biotin carboxyl carrier protein of acetyl-CoA carboxylase n=1 Tax=Bacillus coahuilensis p1.1.43 TaxID=1150625 RepID=A0A147K7Y9_9BACI|nr:acetyl-CoA carboxylase biotin carboxyl carrier protein [Bacillus coahuilensis]KUP06177.1 acetyl-CoA carboxylase [Bacillus coahuilensis p1.1.43]